MSQLINKIKYDITCMVEYLQTTYDKWVWSRHKIHMPTLRIFIPDRQTEITLRSTNGIKYFQTNHGRYVTTVLEITLPNQVAVRRLTAGEPVQVTFDRQFKDRTFTVSAVSRTFSKSGCDAILTLINNESRGSRK